MNSALSLGDFAALGPLLILIGSALVMLLLESFGGSLAKKWVFYVMLGTLVLGLGTAYYAPASTNILLTHWIKFDPLARFFTVFFLAVGAASMLLSTPFLKRFGASSGEYFFLLNASLFGLVLVGSAADLLTLFLGIETLSISLYILCGYMKQWKISHEAAIKYFLMGALGAAFLLYGIALIYGAIGTTRLDDLLSGYQQLDSAANQTLFLAGAALVTVGLAFKAAIVPFHVWAPDAYDGASTPVTAFMSVGTKAGAFAALVRIFMESLPQFNLMWNEGIALLAYPTLIYANVVALRQIQLRRFFAYSGISHGGFLLIPLAVGTPDALPALLFYLVVYALATLGSFAVLVVLDQRSEGVFLRDLHGLFHRSPWLAGLFTLCLLTLGGIPPTAGFFAKFYVFKVAFQSGYYGLVVVGLLTTILSVYYYMRIAALMFSRLPEDRMPPERFWATALVGSISFAAIVMLSLYPGPLAELVSSLLLG
jgi:NADH-quinone oxidoreductase subunit N